VSSFLGRLESGEPGTLVIEYLSVEKVPGASGSGSDTGAVSADINIAVYALLPATG